MFKVTSVSYLFLCASQCLPGRFKHKVMDFHRDRSTALFPRKHRKPTLVKTRHHCQCRSFRYAAQFRCKTFKALSCCCFLAKALKNSKKNLLFKEKHVLIAVVIRRLSEGRHPSSARDKCSRKWDCLLESTPAPGPAQPTSSICHRYPYFLRRCCPKHSPAIYPCARKCMHARVGINLLLSV